MRPARSAGLIGPLALLVCLEVAADAARLPARRQTANELPRIGAGYRRFHANDSFIGQPIPCTDDEKVCFGYNLVLDTDSDTCQAVGEGYVGGCDLRVDRKEYLETSGRVFGVCKLHQDPCPGYRMAYDGRCYTPEVVRNVLCGCDSEPTRHFLGNMECRCAAPTPIKVQQPKEAGRCKIPDLRFPNKTRSFFKQSPLQAIKYVNPNCSKEQKRCFAKGKVWVAHAKDCFQLLKRGPCSEDEYVVLSKEHWSSAPAVCKHVRGDCPPGRIRMAFDGQCHSEREMRISAPGRLMFNILGEYDVLGYNEGIRYIPVHQNNACSFTSRVVNGSPPHRNYQLPTCTQGEPLCALYETISVPPSPE